MPGLQRRQGDCAKKQALSRPAPKKNGSFVKRDEMKLHPTLLNG
jgi:hypothetical protein